MTDKVEKVTDTSNLNKLTLKPYIIKDIDNNIYPVTKIGATYWLRENLRVTHYNDGTPLINRRNATDNDLANGTETQEAVRMFEKAPMYDWYRNIDTNFDAGDSEATKKLYGLNYNLRAVAGDDDPWISPASNDNTQGSLSQKGDSNINEAQTNLQLCPIGWHIATNGVSSFGNNTPDVQYIDDFFVWQWIHMMTDNYASIGTERNLNTAQWPYNTTYIPTNITGLTLNAVPALGQKNEFTPERLSDTNGIAKGIIPFWTDWLLKIDDVFLSGSLFLDNEYESEANTGSTYCTIMSKQSLPIRCVRN